MHSTLASNTDALKRTVQALLEPGKGILALDESNATCTKRFEAAGAPSNAETRRQYRQLLITAPGAEAFISGAILYDETLRQVDDDGTSFVEVLRARNQVAGIKVDTGAKPLAGAPGEMVTEGLDGLRERLAEYFDIGARFAKWRAVIRIGEGLPTIGCCIANVHALARYAALCQETGLVPVIEPEVLLEGSHDIDRCEQVTTENLHLLFRQLAEQRVLLEGTILKTSMVLPGSDAAQPESVTEVADRTVKTLMRCVPPALGGVVFLSGGQSDRQATAHLNAMNRRWADRAPWPMTFSYARALQQPALDIWGRDMTRVAAAQRAFVARARMNSLAAGGKYNEALEPAA